LYYYSLDLDLKIWLQVQKLPRLLVFSQSRYGSMQDTRALNLLSVLEDADHHKEDKDGHTANNYQCHDAAGESS